MPLAAQGAEQRSHSLARLLAWPVVCLALLVVLETERGSGRWGALHACRASTLSCPKELLCQGCSEGGLLAQEVEDQGAPRWGAPEEGSEGLARKFQPAG